MMSKISFDSNKYIERLYYVLIVILFISICFINIDKLTMLITSDHVGEMNYMQAVWENKTIFPEGWYSSTELLYGRLIGVAVLLYGLTGKFLLSYQLTLITCGVVYVACLWIYCRSMFFNKQTTLFIILCSLGCFLQ